MKRTAILLILAVMAALTTVARERTVYAIRLAENRDLYFSTKTVPNMGSTTYSLSAEPEYFNITPAPNGGYHIQSTKNGMWVGVDKWRFTNRIISWDIPNFNNELARTDMGVLTSIHQKDTDKGFGVDTRAVGEGVFTDKRMQGWILEEKKVEVGSSPFILVYDHKNHEAIVAGLWDRTVSSVKIPAVVKDDFGRDYTVKNISNYAFAYCIMLTSVSIPEGVERIGECAFVACTSLSSVKIPESVTYISPIVPFGGCYMLKNKFVNKSRCTDKFNWGATMCVTETKDGLVFNNEKLLGGVSADKLVPVLNKCRPWAKVVNIPQGTAGIGHHAFEYCTEISEIVLPEGVLAIYGSAFEGCSGVKTFVMPKSLKQIKQGAFAGCNPEATLVMGNGKKVPLKDYIGKDLTFNIAEDGNITVVRETKPNIIAIASMDYTGSINDLKDESKKVYTDVEVNPKFPGGNDALISWISSHIQYPAVAQEDDIQGKVVVKFVVNEDGSIGRVVVLQKLHPACDAEAVRVVKSLPRFTPGMQQGEPVKVWFTLPVRFNLM